VSFYTSTYKVTADVAPARELVCSLVVDAGDVCGAHIKGKPTSISSSQRLTQRPTPQLRYACGREARATVHQKWGTVPEIWKSPKVFLCIVLHLIRLTNTTKIPNNKDGDAHSCAKSSIRPYRPSKHC